jgi:glycosyltransferase involved in cell wall biosynthesis
MKSLTILIPTCNRPKELLRLLDLINSQIDQLQADGRVDVLVRDNSENIETKSAIEASEFAGKPWLNYKKNINNLGFDLNVLNAFIDAQGDYVWLIGDDDIVFPGGLQKVFDLIQTDVDMLHLPFKQPQDLTIPQYQVSPATKYWTNIQDVVTQILKYIKITSFVYKKNGLVLDKEKLSKVFSRSGWMHVIIAFEVLVNSKKISTISINEFLAGSLDKEWKVINWTPDAYITPKLLYQHEIFKKFNLNKQVKKFDSHLYYSGLDMTWHVTRGVWPTTVSMKNYLDFGAQYPFMFGLLLRPHILLKYILIRLRLAPYLHHKKKSQKEVQGR